MAGNVFQRVFKLLNLTDLFRKSTRGRLPEGSLLRIDDHEGNQIVAVKESTRELYYRDKLLREQVADWRFPVNLFRGYDRFIVNSRATLADSTDPNTGFSSFTISSVVDTTVTATNHPMQAGHLLKDSAGNVFVVVNVTDANTFEVDRTGCATGTASEVIPAYVGANNYAPDGWEKYMSSYLKLYVLESGKVKAVPDVTGGLQWRFPSWGDEEWWVDQFRGRTVTVGAKLTSNVSNHACIAVWTEEGILAQSPYHSGSGNAEWLEVTVTIPLNATMVKFGFFYNRASGDVKHEEVMLTYGSYIGEGNYVPGHGLIFLRNIFSLDSLAGQSFSDTYRSLNVVSDSQGKIGSGTKAIKAVCFFQDSDASNTYADISIKDYTSTAVIGRLVPSINNRKYAQQLEIILMDNKFIFDINASGVSTAVCYLQPYAVEV